MLRSVPGGRIVVEGGIYSFNSDVSLYLFADDGKPAQTRNAVASATGETTSSGRFTVTLIVPEDAHIGSYTSRSTDTTCSPPNAVSTSASSSKPCPGSRRR